jgi:hypothetical protein
LQENVHHKSFVAVADESWLSFAHYSEIDASDYLLLYNRTQILISHTAFSFYISYSFLMIHLQHS